MSWVIYWYFRLSTTGPSCYAWFRFPIRQFRRALNRHSGSVLDLAHDAGVHLGVASAAVRLGQFERFVAVDVVVQLVGTSAAAHPSSGGSRFGEEQR